MFILGVVVAAAAGLIVVVRGGGGGEGPAEPDTMSALSGRVEPHEYMRFFRRPASYRAEERLLQDAQHRLLERCMERKGYTIEWPPAASDGIIGRVTPDLRFRSQHGYGFAWQGQRRVKEHIPQNEAEEEALAFAFGGDDDHTVVVEGPAGSIGSGTEGCWGEVRIRIFGSIENNIRAETLPGDYSTVIGLQVAEDPRYIEEPMGRWSDCMARHGYSYTSLNDPYFNTQRTYNSTTPRPEEASEHEIEVAVADGECQIEVGLPQVARDLQDELVAALPEEDHRELREIVVLREQALDRAEEVMEEDPGG